MMYYLLFSFLPSFCPWRAEWHDPFWIMRDPRWTFVPLSRPSLWHPSYVNKCSLAFGILNWPGPNCEIVTSNQFLSFYRHPARQDIFFLFSGTRSSSNVHSFIRAGMCVGQAYWMNGQVSLSGHFSPWHHSAHRGNSALAGKCIEKLTVGLVSWPERKKTGCCLPLTIANAITTSGQVFAVESLHSRTLIPADLQWYFHRSSTKGLEIFVPVL